MLGEDKTVSIRTWRKKFNSWCLLQGFRDDTKASENPDHWKADCRNKEIAAFNLALSDDILAIMDTTICEKMTEEQKTQPWKYQTMLEHHFTGNDNVMPERLSFFNCTQSPTESIAEYEQRIRALARKTRYSEMQNPLQELMRDRLCTGVHNTDLRQHLLHHYKDDGRTPYTFEEHLPKAKSWETAHKTNVSIIEKTKTEEQVNFTDRKRSSFSRKSTPTQQSCAWCGGSRHPRRECPAKIQGSFCSNCYMMENHLASVCRSQKDKFKAEFKRKADDSEARPKNRNTAHYT